MQPSAKPVDSRQLLLIIGLAAFACLRPIMSITGLSEQIGKPVASIGMTVIITIVWIVAAIVARVPQPVVTLTLTGIAYGVLAIVLSGILSPILTGELQGPLRHPFAIIAVLATNAIWGCISGLLATAALRARKR
ncbi:hypothetical protein [Cohnella nanjingensis]|uniref:Uncharacterized protein n=1 Tax=Cohnella nanjingensis TaxID=1387779 RepID=A0A7X0RST2_9BACL|nr:hypothetical protein [Cohnella nanjingensis]MBB6672920.1 hypothetical protein [Cohnella nanjingensis]